MRARGDEAGASWSGGHEAVLGCEAAFELAEVGLKAALAAGAGQAEVLIMTEDSALTRYASGRIHQNVAERNAEIRIRAVAGRRWAVAAGNQTGRGPVADIARRAADMAGRSPEDTAFPGLPEPSPDPYLEQTTWYDATAAVSAADRAEVVKTISAVVEGEGAEGFGVVTNGVGELVVANSLGVRAYQAFTDGWISVITKRRGKTDPGREAASGYSSSCHRDWNRLQVKETAVASLGKASVHRPRALSPGRYTVVLEEEAVAELLSFLATGPLNGLAYLEGRSLFAGRLGENRYPEQVTIVDDPADPRGANVSFDFEGVPKRPVTMIDAGRIERVAFDHSTAGRARQPNTAHALPAPNAFGPVPLNLTVNPGTETTDELIARVERGLLITRFHYVNPVDLYKTLLTGMTRDGTFLIEEGRVVSPAPNLRWVDSVDGVLLRTRAVAGGLKLISDGPGYGIRFLTASLVPALLVDDFEITGTAEE